MKRELRFEAVYLFPPERVWRALTEPGELAQWLMKNNFQARIGQQFQFQDSPRPGFNGVVKCEIIELEAPHRLAYKWETGDLQTVVRFLLEPAPGGTRLILEHSGFDNAGGAMISALLSWNRRLQENLGRVLGDGATASIECNMNVISALIERYERFGTAFANSLSRIPAEVMARAASEGEWSAHQTAMHIIDAEIVGAMRLRMIAAQPGSKLTSYAGDVWGRELDYAKQALTPGIELFQALRRTTAGVLRALPEEAWRHRAEHEEAGEVTLATYLDSHCEHAEIHMQEIDTLARRVAVPAD